MSAPRTVAEIGGCELMSLARLRDNPDLLREPEPVIPRLAWAGRVTLLAAREKAGKSTLVAAGVAAMSRGADFLNEHTTSGRALWLSADMESPYDIDRRFLTFGADPDNTYLLMNWDRRPLSFLAWVAKGRPRVAVIDTLPAYAGDIVTDASQSSQWIALLRDICTVARDTGTAFILLHHASKATGEYRDSTHVGAAVDCILTMREDKLAAVRRLTARARWPMEECAVRLVGDRFELVGRELTLDARTLLHIGGAPGTSKVALRRAVGGNAGAVDAALEELVRRGAVRDIGTGQRHRYVIAESLQDKDGQPGTAPGQATEKLSTGAPAGGLVPSSPPLGGQGHPDGSEQQDLPEPDPGCPASCPDCGAGPAALTWAGGDWKCEACETLRLVGASS